MERFRRSVGTMSNGHRRVAEYVVQNYDRAAFLTAAELGQTTGVSESTVVRCAMALGYPGYPEFQEALQDAVKSRLTTVDRLFGPTDAVTPDEDIVTRVMQTDLDAIRFTLNELDRTAFKNAVAAITHARRIIVVGFRSAAALALFLGFNLNWIQGNVKVAGLAIQDLWEDIAHLGRRDVAIGISFPRYTRATVQAMAAAKSHGCTVIVLTNSVLSPMSRHADIVLTARHSIPTYTDSFVAPLSVINALLAATSMANKGRVSARLRKLEDLWKRYRIYETS